MKIRKIMFNIILITLFAFILSVYSTLFLHKSNIVLAEEKSDQTAVRRPV